jgi:hypothetical protein
MATTTLRRYYGLVWKKFWPGWSWGRDRLIPVLGGGIIIILQVRNGIVKPENQLPMVGIVTGAYFAIIAVWLAIKAIHAPWQVHCDQVAAGEAAADQVKQACEIELRTIRTDVAELQRQLVVPKLRPEIQEHQAQEVRHPGEGLVIIGGPMMAGLADYDVLIWICVRIVNEHRIPSTAGCALTVRTRRGEVLRTDWEVNPEARRYPPLDLARTIEYGAPRIGWMYARLRDKRREDVVGGTLILTVADGVDAITSAEAAIP